MRRRAGSSGSASSAIWSRLSPSRSRARCLPRRSGRDRRRTRRILGFTPYLLIASFCAYLVGEFLNSFVLARMKVATNGRWLWTRTIGSTLIGEGADTIIFISLAFGATGALGLAAPLPFSVLLNLMLTQWLIKVGYEIVATPLTYVIVGYLKRRDTSDVYDRHTNFSPIVIGQERETAAVGAAES